ncbi:MAG: 5-formyltetrahydrofolate cyclo-ligase [Sphingomonadaceae bacterium]|nr:5-formyltetrahydrofolate cyclo-ligase [Sphingomonadaceae bacterium]
MTGAGAAPGGLKRALRRDLRAVRAAAVAGLDAAQRGAAAEAVAEYVRPLLRAPVGAYAAAGDEIDPAPAAPGAALPWFEHEGPPMRFRLGPPTHQHRFGPQPGPDAPLVEPMTLLVPLLACTPAGIRLGQGGGFYDRYLAARADRGDMTVVGCAWDCQVVDDLPTEPHDMALDWIATPTRLIRCRA